MRLLSVLNMPLIYDRSDIINLWRRMLSIWKKIYDLDLCFTQNTQRSSPLVLKT